MWPLSSKLSIGELTTQINALQKSLKVDVRKTYFNLYPKTETEYAKSIQKILGSYSKMSKHSDHDILYAISKLALPKNLKKDFNSVCLPKDMCLKQINSGFFGSNLTNFNDGWMIKNPLAWKTHLAGIFNIIAYSTWRSKGTFGNNFLTKTLALLTTTLLGILEFAGIAIFSALKLLRKVLTSIPAIIFFTLGLIFVSLSWIFNKMYGGQLMDSVQPMIHWMLSKLSLTPEERPRSFARRHPFITALGATATVAAVGLATWYFWPQIATAGSLGITSIAKTGKSAVSSIAKVGNSAVSSIAQAGHSVITSIAQTTVGAWTSSWFKKETAAPTSWF